MNIKARISAVGKYLPNKVISNSYFEKILDTSDDWISSRTGIKQRRKLEDGKASSYMAIKSIESMIKDRDFNINEVDVIIVATITPDMMFPSTACLIQKHFGINNCWGFDLSGACSGFLFALETGNNLIKSKQYKKIIVVGVDTMSSILDYEDRSTSILFGDGAGSVLLEPTEEYGIIDSCLGIDGKGGEFLYMPGGGSLNKTSNITVKQKMHYVKQNGSSVFKSAVKGMYEITKRIMDNNNINKDDLKLFIPHQANKRIIDATVNKLGLKEEQVIININKYANTTAASIPIALCEAQENGILYKGNKVILTAFGAGFTWGSFLIEWNYK